MRAVACDSTAPMPSILDRLLSRPVHFLHHPPRQLARMRKLLRPPSPFQPMPPFHLQAMAPAAPIRALRAHRPVTVTAAFHRAHSCPPFHDRRGSASQRQKSRNV